MLNISEFASNFKNLTKNWTWEVEGFLDKNGYVHPIDSDTKVISTVFERLSSPVIRKIAKECGYVVETANQTTYPDFTLSQISGKDRIAIDIKTTYKSQTMVMTLGGYNSFIRNNTKNILYPYDTYRSHWMLGFVYEQNTPFAEYDIDSMPSPGQIPCPYHNVSMFLREKHEISGLRAGSGNTKNIGSVRATKFSDFSESRGPFCFFEDGKGACDHYWRNYEKYSLEISNKDQLLRHPDFQKFGIK